MVLFIITYYHYPSSVNCQTLAMLTTVAITWENVGEALKEQDGTRFNQVKRYNFARVWQEADYETCMWHSDKIMSGRLMRCIIVIANTRQSKVVCNVQALTTTLFPSNNTVWFENKLHGFQCLSSGTCLYLIDAFCFLFDEWKRFRKRFSKIDSGSDLPNFCFWYLIGMVELIEIEKVNSFSYRPKRGNQTGPLKSISDS